MVYFCQWFEFMSRNQFKQLWKYCVIMSDGLISFFVINKLCWYYCIKNKRDSRPFIYFLTGQQWTDIDIERLSSSKFATNALVLGLSVLVYNILRWIGQNGLLGVKSPKCSKVQRRWIRTVMQEPMYVAARIIKISFSCSTGVVCLKFVGASFLRQSRWKSWWWAVK